MQFNRILSAALAAGIALASVACQKVDELTSKPAQVSGKSLTVTATIADIDGTKVEYSFTGTGDGKAKSAIKQTWEVNDQIFGFDKDGDTFTFTVSEVDQQTGKATFNASETNLNGTLYAVYYPGKGISDINDQTLAVDLSNNDEDNQNNGVLNGTGTNAPVIMCATATIGEDGNVSFTFINQTAVVGIYKMQVIDGGKPIAANKEISSVTLNNVYTSGTIKLDGENFGLVANKSLVGNITANATLITVNDGYIDANVSGEGAINAYFSVIPENYKNITVTAKKGEKTYSTTGSITGNLLAGKYYYIGKKIGIPVATIGETEYFTISDAFNAVESEQTIKLKSSEDEDGWYFDKEIRFPSEKWNSESQITLDLNGQTLTGQNATNGRIVLDNENVTLTIKGGGTITHTGFNADVIKVEAGHLVVDNATIKASQSEECTGGNAAIWVQGPEDDNEQQTNPEASVTIKANSTITGAGTTKETDNNAYALYVDNTNATVKIEGGTFSSQSHNVNIVNAKNVADGAGVSITGGTFICETASKPTLSFAGDYTCNIGDGNGNGPVVSSASNPITIKSDGISINVKNGKFKTSSPIALIVARGSFSPTISISGGKFSRSSSYIAEGHTCCKTELENDYPWEVVGYGENKALVIASGGDSYALKKTINDAVSYANTNGGKIILVDNCTVEGTSNVDFSTGTVTLDLNGKTLEQNANGRIRVNGATLTLKDSQTGGKITQVSSANGYTTFVCASGILTIESGTITQNDKGTAAALQVSGGTLNVKGGKIIGTTSHALNITGGTNVNITDGEIQATTATKNAIYVKTSTALNVNITGGLIQSTADKTNERTYAIYVNKIASGGSFIINGGDYRSKDRVICSTTDNVVGVKIEKQDGITEPRFYSYDVSGISAESKVNLFYCPDDDKKKITYEWGYYGCASDKAYWGTGGYLKNISDYQLITFQTTPAKYNELEYWRRVKAIEN